jgi:hypothetical protein
MGQVRRDGRRDAAAEQPPSRRGNPGAPPRRVEHRHRTGVDQPVDGQRDLAGRPVRLAVRPYESTRVLLGHDRRDTKKIREERGPLFGDCSARCPELLPAVRARGPEAWQHGLGVGRALTPERPDARQVGAAATAQRERPTDQQVRELPAFCARHEHRRPSRVCWQPSSGMVANASFVADNATERR